MQTLNRTITVQVRKEHIEKSRDLTSGTWPGYHWDNTSKCPICVALWSLGYEFVEFIDESVCVINGVSYILDEKSTEIVVENNYYGDEEFTATLSLEM